VSETTFRRAGQEGNDIVPRDGDRGFQIFMHPKAWWFADDQRDGLKAGASLNVLLVP
jgi:hypothetical protein